MVDKEALLNEIGNILETHLEGHLPDFVLVDTMSDLVDLFESIGADFNKLEECDGITSWLLRETLDDQDEREQASKFN